ncbi:hypothetical protein G6F59_018323 [Rhizopus arrhizus]|nr:hypothetical protein G6F59_018323 [Rhizopus arrhizus]
MDDALEGRHGARGFIQQTGQRRAVRDVAGSSVHAHALRFECRERRLRGVESLAAEQAQSLLGDLAEGDATGEAEDEGSDGEEA